jgi:hypothetical protein
MNPLKPTPIWDDPGEGSELPRSRVIADIAGIGKTSLITGKQG